MLDLRPNHALRRITWEVARDGLVVAILIFLDVRDNAVAAWQALVLVRVAQGQIPT